MKLFSSCGKDATYKKLYNTVNDIAIAVALAVYAIIVCVWFISPVFAKNVQEVATEAETVECVEESVVIEEKQVGMDETLALAVGIDAVISSVPDSDYANDITMIMVGNTIMNRVDSSNYPNSVEEVLCQPKQFSCFADTGLKWVGRAATDEAWKGRCLAAAARVIAGERMLSPAVVNVSSSQVGTCEAQLDGLYFCK